MDDSGRGAIDSFIIELVNTRKFLQFYPANNLKVRESLASLWDKFRGLIDGAVDSGNGTALAIAGLVFRVERRHLYYGDVEVGKGFGPVGRFATDLYKLGIKTFHISADCSRGDLHHFLDAVSLKPEVIREEGGLDVALANAGVSGIQLGEPKDVSFTTEPPEPGGAPEHNVDLLGYLRSAQALRRIEDPDSLALSPEDEATADFSELTDFFSDVLSGSEEKVTYLMETLSDPERLSNTLSHIYGIDTASEESATGGSARIMRQSFHELVKTLGKFPKEMREEYVRNIGLALLSSDPEVQSLVVKEALPGQLGEEGSANAILSMLPDGDIAEALLQSVRFHEGTTQTILNFLDEFMTDPRRRAAVLNLIARLSADDDNEAVAKVIELLHTEAGHKGAPPAGEYTGGLLPVDHEERETLEQTMSLHQGELDEIEELAESDCEYRTPRHAARTLLELYITPTIEGVSKLTAERLAQQLMAVLEEGSYEYLAELLRVVETGLPESVQSRVRPQLEAVISECAYPQHLNRIFSKLRKADAVGYEYEQLLQLLDYLGDRVVEHLFLRLEMENSRPMRMFFLGLFREFGDKVIPVLQRKMKHRDWFVVRNAVHILGNLDTDVAMDSLITLLDYPDMRVRREVVRAIAKIGGKNAEDALLSLLDDEEAIMRRLAAERLGYMGCERALPVLTERLAKTSSNDLETLIGLIRAVGILGGPAESGLIRQALPRVAFWGSEKKRELSHVGREAIDRIETQAVIV